MWFRGSGESKMYSLKMEFVSLPCGLFERSHSSGVPWGGRLSPSSRLVSRFEDCIEVGLFVCSGVVNLDLWCRN